jgi:hypothetical protein
MVSIPFAPRKIASLNMGFLLGGKDLEEIELTHLDGHKGSKPVRIGNGAADHVQLVRFFVLSSK